MKRKGVSTLFIRSYLRALSYSLDHLLLLWQCACGVGFEIILKNLFVMVLVSIRTRTKFCFEKWFKEVFVNHVLKSVLKRGFAMVLVSIRTYTKRFCLFEIVFEMRV